MKLLPILSLALTQLRRRWRNASLLVLAFAASTALLFTYVLLRDALVARAGELRAEMPELVVSQMSGGRPRNLTLSDQEALAGIPALAKVRPRIWGYLFSPALQGNLLLVGREPDGPPLQGTLEGRDLQNDGEMVLGGALADALGARLGDQLALPSPYANSAPLSIVGVVRRSYDWWAGDVVFVRDARARELLGLGADQATDFALELTNPAEKLVIANAVGQRLPGARVIDREATYRLYSVAYGWRSGLATVCVAPALLALLLLAAERTAGLNARERREIALQKALGFSTREVLSVRLFEAVLLANLGVALGALVAHVWVFGFDAAGLSHALLGFGVLIPHLHFEPSTPPTALLGLGLIVIAPYAALAAFAAWRVASADPALVLRT